MKVFYGPLEIASQAALIGGYLREKGIHIEFGFYGQNPFSEDTEGVVKIDNLFQKLYAFIRLFKRAFSADILHLHFGLSLGLHYFSWDLPFFRSLGKKVIMQFHGCDIRYRSRAIELGIEMCQQCPYPCDEQKKRKRLDYLRRFVDAMIVTTPDLLYFAPEALFIPQMVKVPPSCERSNQSQVTILHAASDPPIKGSRFILQILEKLRKDLNFRVIYLEKVPHQELLNAIQKSTLVIDQILCGWYGVLSCEAMARGKPVIAFIREDWKKQYQPDLPIISASSANLEDILRELLKAPEELESVGEKSRSFALRVHSPEAVGQKILNVYSKILNPKTP